MKILIIEDESRAANHLERELKKVAPEAVILDKLESVEEALEWLQQHPVPELIFSDIQLADETREPRTGLRSRSAATWLESAGEAA